MEISVETLESGIKKITLRGRMDIEGTNEIALRLSSETSTEKSGVETRDRQLWNWRYTEDHAAGISSKSCALTRCTARA